MEAINNMFHKINYCSRFSKIADYNVTIKMFT